MYFFFARIYLINLEIACNISQCIIYHFITSVDNTHGVLLIFLFLKDFLLFVGFSRSIPTLEEEEKIDMDISSLSASRWSCFDHCLVKYSSNFTSFITFVLVESLLTVLRCFNIL
jgi:hypothetical protein